MEGGQANMSSKDFIKTLRKTSQSSLGDMAFTFRSGNYYEMALQIFLAIPCEAIAFAAGYDNYEWFRITKLARFYYSRVYWSDVKFHLIKCKVNFEGGWDRVVLFCITQAVFSHVAACIYYRIAVTSIDSGNYSNWLLHDNNAYIDNVTGELVYIRKMDAVYLRAFYWAVQTVETVGYGDICAYNLRETVFCLIVFYSALFIVQSSIANVVLMMTSQDETVVGFVKRTSKFDKYSRFRQLSDNMHRKCNAYYNHQFKILKGLNETELISEFPSAIRNKIFKKTILNYLRNVATIKKIPADMVAVILNEVQVDIYSPGDIIVNIGTRANGLYIVSRGVVVVSASNTSEKKNKDQPVSSRNSPHMIAPTFSDIDQDVENMSRIDSPDPKNLDIYHSLKEGDVFGEKSLFVSFEYTSTYEAKSFCELIHLTANSFRRVCEKYMDIIEMTAFFETERQSYSMPENDNGEHSLMADEPINLDEDLIESRSSKKGAGYNRKRRGVVHGITVRVVDVDEESSQISILKSDSYFRFVWNLVVSFAILYYFFSCPVLITYSFHDKIIEENMGVFILAYIADGIVFINFILELNFFYIVKDGIVVHNHHDIVKNYLSKHNIYVMALVLMPYDIIGVIIGNNNLIPLLRLSKLYHICYISEYLIRLKEFTVHFPYTLVRLLSLIFVMYMLIHWLGCIFVTSAKVSTEIFGMDTNWIEVNNRSEIWNFDYDQFSRLAQYFHSIYWALYSSSSIGYYDILATNNLETLTVALVLLFGCQMLNGLLGGISTVMRSFSDGVVARQYKMQMIKDLCVHKGLPSSTRDNIYYFFEYQWNRSAGVDESAVLQELPVALRTSIVNEIAGSVLKKIPFFVDCPEFILHEILRMLTTRAFMDQDAIVEAGEYGRDMFIIQSGFAVITPADRSKVFASLGPGDYLGESCLLGLDVKQRAASAYALGYVYTYVLRNIDYAAITDLYPLETAPIEKKIRNVLEQKIAKNNKIIAADHQNETSSCTASETSDFSSNLLTGSSTISMLHPNSKERKIWEVLLLLIVLYNMFMIPLRIAIRLPGKYFMVDYILDIILLLDMYMTYAKFYSIREGRVVTNPEKIKSMFLEQNFKRSFYAYIPFDILAIVMISQTKTYVYWTLTVLRVPKLILSVDYMKHFSAVEDLLDQLKVPYVAGRVANLLLIIIMVGHWAACGFYMLPFLVNKEEEYENCIPEENALYGTACQFEGTWIQMQIMTGKLPLDGGSTWDLYVRSLNWAIPTLTLEVLADIFPINATEMMYAFFAMFFGLILNATVIGTIIGLLSSDEESADVQIVRLLLEERNVHPLLRNKVINYLTFLNSNYGKLVQSEEQLIRELPFSLQSSIIEKSKLVLLEKCPIFDYCSQESKRNLCFALKLQIFGDGDTIIKSGDMGNEMFFLSEGSVQICSDSGSVFATLNQGSFFGETGMVFSDKRVANVKALGVCMCYCLLRQDLDNELRSCSAEDATNILSHLRRLLDNNIMRNRAIAKNLEIQKDPTSKLSKMIRTDIEIESEFVKMLRNPNSTFRLCWDIVGFVNIIFLAYTIPFYFTYLFGDAEIYHRPYLVIDFLVDFYFMLDIYFRAKYFPVLEMNGKYITDTKKIHELYVAGDMTLDCISSMPLEIFAAIPNTSPMLLYALRFIHCIRLRHTFKCILTLDRHLQRFEIRIIPQLLELFKAFLLYVMANHYVACGFFMIHRYLERNHAMSWAIADHLATFDPISNQHNICDQKIMYCYLRSIYFVLSTLTSVGYGDLVPYNNIEFFYEIFLVALPGALLNALVCGCFGNLFTSFDNTSLSAFKKKMAVIDQLVEYRTLSEDIYLSIIAQYEHIWNLERQTGKYEDTNFIAKLSPSLAGEISLVLRRNIIEIVPIFKKINQGRIARALHPQILLRGITLYSEGDIAEDIFFVRKGSIRGGLPKNSIVTTKEMYLEVNKNLFTRGTYSKGYHFGELCLISSLSLRRSVTMAEVHSELYSVNKKDLWEILSFMMRKDQREFLISLFTELGECCHTEPPDIKNTSSVSTNYLPSTIDNLYTLTQSVIDEIVDVGITKGLINEAVKRQLSSLVVKKRKQSVNAARASNNWLEALRVYELQRASEQAKLAPLKDSKSHIDIDLSHIQDRVELTLRERCENLFKYIDTDGSGKISREELKAGLGHLGFNMSWEDIDDMMDGTDVDGDEEIDIDEVIDAICAALELNSNDAASLKSAPKSLDQ